MGGSYSSNVQFRHNHLEELVLSSTKLDPPSIHSEKENSGSRKKLRFVCISDTHTRHSELDLPQGDVLIHSGDFLKAPSPSHQLNSFNEWLGTLSFTYKIVVCGNHDKAVPLHLSPDEIKEKFLFNCTHYLQDSGVEIEGIKIWGSPWHIRRPLLAFTTANHCGLTEEEVGNLEEMEGSSKIESHFNSIPNDTDILITHVPPICVRDTNNKGKPNGSRHLLVTDLLRVKPKVHVFGHNHDQPGISLFQSNQNQKILDHLKEVYGLSGKGEEEGDFEILYINASQPYGHPIVFDYYYD
eukprot:TRINITY_DN8272_c0_g1_i1.p1 TRINITY_DN8272_c0_g1~~TRINITY_DN8272_c0_g1_i1.p1  ORF type:complete len:297 (+),score=72.14 TRINITY_DN8272_c0_g1_i1:79-969(+)